jgi:ADP-ribose pyrophosphatase
MQVETIESKPVYAGKIFNVRQDLVLLPGGKFAELDILEHHGAVVIIPLDVKGLLWFIRQYRHAAGEVLLELPAGTLETDETAEACAHREIREEIGMAAGNLIKIGEFFIAPGYSTEYLSIFLAKDLKYDPLPGDADELITVEKVSIVEAYRMVERGLIRDAKTLAALLLLKNHL